MSVSTLIISQALVKHQDGVSLHPDLFVWEKQFSAYKQSWFDCANKNPLAWYAALCEISPSALLAEKCSALPDEMQQCWVVSPYHAELHRTTVRVYPEGLFPWTLEDATYLCETLNPLLAEEGMQLFCIGAAIMLTCRDCVEAYPLSFGEISGQMLPDNHHAGEDGGRLNRLLSEIQMLLFQHPSVERHDRGEVDVNGLWLWAPIDLSDPAMIDVDSSHDKQQIAVATRNPVLRSIAEGRDATVMITEAERLHELVQADAPLPKAILLAGEGHAVWLRKSIFPRFGKLKWLPKSLKQESDLLSSLRSCF